MSAFLWKTKEKQVSAAESGFPWESHGFHSSGVAGRRRGRPGNRSTAPKICPNELIFDTQAVRVPRNVCGTFRRRKLARLRPFSAGLGDKLDQDVCIFMEN